MEFTPIDLHTWPRAQMFTYFAKMAPTGYSLTVDVDVTAMRATLKAAGLRFFPAYLWLTTRCLCEQTEFRLAEREGQLGYYDTLTPLYATFHEDDHTFSLMWTPYDADSARFMRPIWTTSAATAATTACSRRRTGSRRRTRTPSPVCRGSAFATSPCTRT